MQKISYRMSLTLRGLFDRRGFIPTQSYITSTINYTLNNVFSLMFRASTEGDIIEVPVFVSDYMLNKLITKDYKDIVMPFLLPSFRTSVYRTTDALLRNLVDFTAAYSQMCRAAKDRKGNLYYGTNGIIFNKDLTPLLLNVILYDKRFQRIIGYRSYIHPSVFLSEGPIEKCIINKIIPYFLETGVSDCTVFDMSVNLKIPEIVVTDVKDKFFWRPVEDDTFTNDVINDTLGEHIDELCNIITEA